MISLANGSDNFFGPRPRVDITPAGRRPAPDGQPAAVVLLQDEDVAAGLPAGFPLDRVLDVEAVVDDGHRVEDVDLPSDSR